MKLILIFLIIALTECKIFRYRRSSILEAACKRKPFLGFCKDGSGSRTKINPSRPLPFRPQPSRPSPTRTSRPQPTRPKSSQPFPFGASERFGGRLGGGDFDRSDRLEATGGNSNWRKISGTNRPSTVSESLGLGGGGGGGGGGIGVGSGVGVGVPGVGPIGVNSGLGIGGGGLGLGNGGLFGISSGLGIGIPGVGPIGVSSGLGIGRK
uniref:Uncharacterized protein n=1 Tax=Panagrolaimus davidi TaxID=227884 RepID=A0A914Q0L0_9BILA